VKNIKAILILIFLIFITSCTKYETIFIDNGVEKVEIKAEVADTDEKKERGLQFRKSLKENSGMFFVFGTDSTYNFWMKNTLIPLDIIFISNDLVIIDIIYAEPCVEEPCENYKTSEPSRFILEVNGNFTIRNNIKAGNRITIE